jgi:xanthine/CO dehydrogenase XdhC/CoxF family maturation factor
MSDLVQILPLWQALRAERIEYVLATVMEVEGSGYRKPGARMLIAADGRRAGTISGGCLEAEVARKAFWHTENGPVMRRYSTSPDDGEVPYGMGCGGVVHLLLERAATADPLLEQLSAAFANRHSLAIATVIEGDAIGQRAWLLDDRATGPSHLSDFARQACAERRSFTAHHANDDRQIAAIRAEWLPARPGLFIFGAGDDAVPLLTLAHQLGWYLAVADGRSHLVNAARFPLADDRYTLITGSPIPVQPRHSDAAVIMTHSLEQDTHILAHLLNCDLSYLGVLGPRHRTIEMLSAILRNQPPHINSSEQIERCLERLHAPMGLDLGGTAPADIALAVIAEIQQTLHRASGRSLHEIRSLAGEGRKSPVTFPRSVSIA